MSMVRISPADTAFSKCIRERDDRFCQRCGRRYPKNSADLHCSHNFSRRYRNIRWHPLNAMALGLTCHRWYGGSPRYSALWLENKIGLAGVEELRRLRDTPLKISKKTEKEIAAHYRRELKIMEAKRAAGISGRIPFAAWLETW